MKNMNAKKKIFSAIAVLALSATAIGGAISISGCGSKYISDGKGSEIVVENNKTKISTAVGTVYSEDSGNVYYVASNGGSISSADGTLENPYDFYALLADTTKLQPGDTVYVMPGTYSYSVTLRLEVSGEYNKYIKVLNAAYAGIDIDTGEDKEVILDFSAQDFASTARGVQIYGNYIYWYGIDICGAGDNGMYIGGNYNTIEYSEFFNNRDTGLQLGRSFSEYTTMDQWPNYNLIKNCTSHNNYDNETYGENADGFAAKLTVGYGNVFDGCIAYRNSDDGWDLYAKVDSGNIGTVIMYNCVAFENGYLEYTQQECNKLYPEWDVNKTEAKSSDGSPNLDGDYKYGNNSYKTRNGDGNGFKLGGSVMEGDVILVNCLSFNNRMHGVTDNSNPGVITLIGVTSYNNSAAIDDNPSSANFGYINSGKNDASHANIDLARQTYSYNNLNKVLAVKDSNVSSSSLSEDAYRGSVANSVLGNKKIEGAIDTKGGGSSYSAPASTDVFEKLPYTSSGRNIWGYKDLGTFTYTKVTDETAEEVKETYEVSLDLNPNRVHLKYRNAVDGSINMGDILKIKDSYNPISGVKIGAYLSKSSWGDYEHFYASDYVSGNSLNASKVARALETLKLTCDPENVYQDFEVPNKMTDCSLVWTTSGDNADMLEVCSDIKTSISGSEYITIKVYRDASADKHVTLTATITCGDVTQSKDFDVVVKKGDPSIGEIYVTTSNGEVINNGGSYVVDRYSIFREPAINVENGLDYNGKLLKENQYSVKTTYIYQTDSTAPKVQVKGYTPSTAGVYTITHKVTLTEGKNAGSTKSMSYKVFTASADANVQFVGSPSLSLGRDGYTIKATLSSATGYLYAYSSTTEVDVTKDNIKELGTPLYFRSENIQLSFENSNNGAYYIYYALANANGTVTSSVKKTQISVVDISTTDNFLKIAGGGKVGSETPATTIYNLTTDLDFSGESYSLSSNSFSGLLNGHGHTVKNITTSSGVFYKVSGGTIMNVKFDGIKANGSSKIGIVSEMAYGYIHNVQVLNSSFTSSGERASALVALMTEGLNPSYISNVYVDGNTKVVGGGRRVGGIIGHIQSTSSPSYAFECYISDCLVSANIKGGGTGTGGIVGESDPNKIVDGLADYHLSLTRCVFDGEVYGTDASVKVGGMIGDQKSASVINIDSCISIGKIYYDVDGKKAESSESIKNSSGIIGGYSVIAELNVKNCLALFEEYNTNNDVTVPDNITIARQFEDRVGNTDCWTIVYAEGSTDTVVAPYVQLNFLD